MRNFSPSSLVPRGWSRVPGLFLRAAVLAAGVFALTPGASAADFATVLRVSGAVEFDHAGNWSPAKAGTVLDQGDELRTGDKGFATVRDARGAVTDLYPLTTLAITQDSELSVEMGRIWSHFLHVIGAPRQIRTPDAVAMIRGTTLSVDVAGKTDNVTVLEGHVEVLDHTGHRQMVDGGFAVDVHGGVLAHLMEADPEVLEQGRSFLERALPLLQMRPSAIYRNQNAEAEHPGGPGSPQERAGRPGEEGVQAVAPSTNSGPNTQAAPGMHAVPGPANRPRPDNQGFERRPDAAERAEMEWHEQRGGFAQGLPGAPEASEREREHEAGRMEGRLGEREHPDADARRDLEGPRDPDAALELPGRPGMLPVDPGSPDRVRGVETEELERARGGHPEPPPVSPESPRGAPAPDPADERHPPGVQSVGACCG